LRRAARALVLVALLGGGCGKIIAVTPDGGAGGAGGGGGGGAGGGGATVTAAMACQQVATAICTGVNGCAPFLIKVTYGDLQTCIDRTALGCTNDQMVPDMPRTVEDLLACATAVGGVSCADALAAKFPPVCLFKPGPRADGAACGSSWQCASTYCKTTDACGVCAARADVGGACSVNGGCLDGLVCAANGVCVGQAGPNVACNANHPCRSDLYCTGNPGTCQPKMTAAGTCADSDQACDIVRGFGCNGLNKTCEMVNVASGGDACGIVNNALTVCAGLNPCPGVTLLKPMGVCANPAADGAPCGDAANGTNCVPPATCVSGLCRLPSTPTCN